MFGKMMNNFYYGKSGKGDYRKEDLPKNRWELFWEMLRVRFSGLIRLNLLYMLIWLPAILVIVLTAMLGIAQALDVIGESMELTAQMQAEILEILNNNLFGLLLLLIPCIAITGPFTAGLSYVTRNWARDEHSFIWSDFKDAMKANWKQALLTSSLTAIFPFLVYVGYQTYGEMINTMGMFFIVPQVLMIMLGLVWSLTLIYIYPMMVTYKLTYPRLIKNALMLAVGKLPQNVGLRLISLLPAAIALAAFMMTMALDIIALVLVALYMLILFALNRFIYASYTNGVFDKYINAHIQGVQVNRGLSDEDEDEDEDEKQV